MICFRMFCLLLVFAPQLSMAKDACPVIKIGGPNAQGLYCWYSPFCHPDSGATSLWLPGSTTPKNCPNDGPPCVGGLRGSVPEWHVGDLYIQGYDNGSPDPISNGQEFVVEKNGDPTNPQPHKYDKLAVYKVKMTVNPAKPSAVHYAHIVVIDIPAHRTVAPNAMGKPVWIDVQKCRLIGGWQVKAPDPSDPATLAEYKPVVSMVASPSDADKRARVVISVDEDGNAVIADVAMHKGFSVPK